MSRRPEYIKCIRQTHEERKHLTWCGKSVMANGWAFVDIDHAAHTRLNKDRLLVCPECVNKVVAALRDAT